MAISGWWWLEPRNFMTFHSVGNNNPNWLYNIFQRGWNHQPVMHWVYIQTTIRTEEEPKKTCWHITYIINQLSSHKSSIQWFIRLVVSYISDSNVIISTHISCHIRHHDFSQHNTHDCPYQQGSLCLDYMG